MYINNFPAQNGWIINSSSSSISSVAESIDTVIAHIHSDYINNLCRVFFVCSFICNDTRRVESDGHYITAIITTTTHKIEKYSRNGEMINIKKETPAGGTPTR